jgi:hypothetical protein
MITSSSRSYIFFAIDLLLGMQEAADKSLCGHSRIRHDNVYMSSLNSMTATPFGER